MPSTPIKPDYTEELQKTKSLLISTELQKRRDIIARALVEKYDKPLAFEPLHDLMIELHNLFYLVKRIYEDGLVRYETVIQDVTQWRGDRFRKSSENSVH